MKPEDFKEQSHQGARMHGLDDMADNPKAAMREQDDGGSHRSPSGGVTTMAQLEQGHFPAEAEDDMYHLLDDLSVQPQNQ